MRFCHKLSSLALALPIVCALAATSPGTAFGEAPQEGLWREAPHKLALTIEVKPNNDLVIRQASPNDCCSQVGDLIGEAHPRGPDQWIGRHTWGGPKQPPRTWGQPAGLLIRRVGADAIFVQYRDSRYSGGWTYKKDARR